MIHSPHFIWTHIGRTGGYSVDKMFRILNRFDIHLDPINAEFSDWKRHQTYLQRAAEMPPEWLYGKEKVLSIRRLPAWILSYAEYKNDRQGIPFDKKDLIQVKLRSEYRDLESGETKLSYHEFSPEEMLVYYDYGNVNHWLRTEYLVADFIRIFGQWYDIRNDEVSKLAGVFENSNAYRRDIRQRFTKAEMEQMYHRCPIWTALEKRLYGGLLV
jgi:hypothetical protein